MLDIKKLLTKILSYLLSNRFAIEWKTLDFGSCRNQTDYRQTLDITKSGYNGWGVIAWEITGSWKTHFTITEMQIANWTTLCCSIRSTNATSFRTDHTYVKALVLYHGGGGTP